MTDNTRKIGIAHFSAIAVAPADFVTLASGAGFSRIGLRLHPAFAGAPFYELPPGSEAAREVSRRLEGEGVELYDIEFVVIDADFRPSDLKSVLEAAANLNARRLSVCGDDADCVRLVDNFIALCDLAAEFALGVDLENMGWRPVARGSDSISIVQKADRKNSGVLVDALHFCRNGGKPEELNGKIGALVRSVQLCDASGPAPVTFDDMMREARAGRVAPGLGDLPLVDLVRAVPAGAAMSVEVPLTGNIDPQRHAATLFAAADRILAAAGIPA